MLNQAQNTWSLFHVISTSPEQANDTAEEQQVHIRDESGDLAPRDDLHFNRWADLSTKKGGTDAVAGCD